MSPRFTLDRDDVPPEAVLLSESDAESVYFDDYDNGTIVLVHNPVVHARSLPRPAQPSKSVLARAAEGAVALAVGYAAAKVGL